ncbi:hypothetical protein M878_42155 [Streptomyces roseochromogenus subsp. oscitans DS 12.976]|uniref:Uncharacterized protein n=1 Tax=Streptomyces roseochromogenus subsp. oscitans DS 12.976 TaxID=1352936 RepID=V6JHY4_STRRC|nr:hypothetical protein M878_42155 [Streptomyces roseochromogenus subsp. oscitans DS 12.976]
MPVRERSKSCTPSWVSQMPDLLGQSRLRHERTVGGAGEAAVLGDGEGGTQQTRVDIQSHRLQTLVLDVAPAVR